MPVRQEIPKLCMLCGAVGHVQGPECPDTGTEEEMTASNEQSNGIPVAALELA